MPKSTFWRILLLFLVILLHGAHSSVTRLSRDDLLELNSRHTCVVLKKEVRDVITRLHLRRRGCRSGQHHRNRARVARTVTSPARRADGGIPVIYGNRPPNVNNEQLINGRHDSRVLRALPFDHTTSPTLFASASPAVSNVSVINSDEQALSGWQSVVIMSYESSSQCMSNSTLSLKSHVDQTTSSTAAVDRRPSTQHSPSLPTTDINWPASPVQHYNSLSSAVNEHYSDAETASGDRSTSFISPASIRSIRSVPSSLTGSDAVLNNSHECSSQSDNNLDLSYCFTNYTWIHHSPAVKRFVFPTVLLANLRGSLCTKLDELCVVLSSNHVDIAALTETWLHDGITDDLLQIPGYCLHRRDRQDGRTGGGVAAYVKQGLPCFPQPQYNDISLEVLWLLFRQNVMPREYSHLLIATVYHPPKANNAEMTDYLINVLDSVNKDHPNLGLLLCGDFNQLPESQLRSYPLSQVVTAATRRTAILDKIFTNLKSWYQPPIVLPAVGSSDHDAVLLPPAAAPSRPPKRKCVTFSRSSDPNGKAMICHYLKHFNWSRLYVMNSCQDMVQYFYSVVLYLLDTYLPVVRRESFSCDKPWVTPEFRQLIKRRQRAFLSGQLSLYRQLRNRTKRTAVTLRKKYFEKKIESLHSLDPHTWWTKIKHFLNSSNSNHLEGLQNSQPDVSLADLINDFFVGISAGLPSIDLSVLSDLNDDYTDDLVIDPAEVDIRLSRIKIHKAPGPDGIPNWFLRDFSSFLCQPIAAIFNASIREGVVPAIWKSAEVVPIPKVHPPTSIQNDLRPISLLPTIAKVFEGVVKGWISPLLEPSLDINQFGCRPGRSTTHALIAIQHTWMETLDNKGSVRALFVDFKKAFDIVNHNILFNKLKKFNISHCLLKWVASYLFQRTQRVRVHNQISSWKTLSGSMPQGSRLGPLAFIVMIDDLKAQCEVHKFVDDTTLSELIPPSHPATGMAGFFTHLLTWTADNDMQINTSKTKEMILGRINPADIPLLSTPVGSVERVTNFKLLGVHLEASLSWAAHINHIVAKASKRLYFLKQLKRAGVPQQQLLHFYTAVIRPVLEYASPVWHYAITRAQATQLESVQKRAIHIIFNLTRGSSYLYLLAIASLDSLQDRRENTSKSTFQKISQSNSCLNYLLPPLRDTTMISRLRITTPYPRPTTRTKKYQSFINFALNKYQTAVKF